MFLSYMGEDRGAQIEIQNSTFKHSSFCKGLIYYKNLKSIEFQDGELLVNFTAQFNRSEVFYELKDEPQVLIEWSLFQNLAFHEVVHGLTRTDIDPKVSENIRSFFDYEWEPFSNRGLILNMQKWAGAIEVSNSTIDHNMVYIKEILIEEQETTYEYYDVTDQDAKSDFSDTNEEILKFKICQTDYTSRYYFNDVIRPNEEFDDNGILYAETMAPFFIKGVQGIVIFTNNTFSDNIGTTGGVIHYEQPNMMTAIANEKRAYIVIKDNRFRNNMAYFAGNAFHLTYKMRMYETNYDAEQVCGAGILIEENSFIGNIGLKKHNGGVGVIRCIHLPTL